MDLDDELLNELFSALGAHLDGAGVPVTVIVEGGANLAARGNFVDQARERLRRELARG